jgi:hypothetical protein
MGRSFPLFSLAMLNLDSEDAYARTTVHFVRELASDF